MTKEKEITFEERKKSWLKISIIDEAEFDAKWEYQNQRQSKVPQPGQEAPNFELHLLDQNRKLTGEAVSLQSFRGTPVALFFCSYT